MQKVEIIEYNNQVRAAAAAAAEAGETEGKEDDSDNEDDLKEQEIPKHIQVISLNNNNFFVLLQMCHKWPVSWDTHNYW